MNSTTIASTGHLAMSQMVTAVEPTPSDEPTCSATGPVSTRAASTRASISTSTNVTSICSGRSLMKERPSSTS